MGIGGRVTFAKAVIKMLSIFVKTNKKYRQVRKREKRFKGWPLYLHAAPDRDFPSGDLAPPRSKFFFSFTCRHVVKKDEKRKKQHLKDG